MDPGGHSHAVNRQPVRCVPCFAAADHPQDAWIPHPRALDPARCWTGLEVRDEKGLQIGDGRP